MVLDKQTGKCSGIDKPLLAEIGAGGRSYFRLAVGSTEYLSKISFSDRSWRFDFIGAYPNPFNRLVRMRYFLPASGITEVKLSILSVSGKTIFEITRASGMVTGVQEILWNGIDNRKRHVGAGVYVVRITAFDEKANIAGTFEKKITYAP
jgi:hypothetical protein